jgi:hypothetical protein
VQNDNVTNNFLNCFSKLNVQGIDQILKDEHTYEKMSKTDFILLLKDLFEGFKRENVQELEVHPGVCEKCNKGCNAYTFLYSKNGFYLDLFIEVENNEIIDLYECFHIKNSTDINKKERIVINSNPSEEIPF